MKGNIAVRLMAIMVLLPMVIAHLFGQVDLLAPNWLWISAFAGLMGLQATYTGFCPAGFIAKFSKNGQCCEGGACGTTPAKEKSTSSACCAESPKTDSKCCSDDVDCCSSDGKRADQYQIKVLGTGCANCNNTYQQIEKVCQKLGVNAELQKVEDMAEIAKYGVMTTPSVVVNEKVVHSGSVPTAKMVEAWFK